MGSVPALTATATLAGLNDITGGGYEPPDVQVAAGAGFLAETVNLALRVWRTGGGPPQVAQTLPLAVFFRTGADRLTDPRVLYDAQSGRWLASVSDVDRGSVLVAASRGTDPTGGWSVYAFAAKGCADQPRLGVADGVVVVAADVFATCDRGFSPVVGSEIWVLNKQELEAGAAAVPFSTYGPDRRLSSLAPVQSLSPTSTEYVVSVDVPSSRVVHLLAVDGVPPAAVRVQELAALPVSPLGQPPNAAQPPAKVPGRPPVLETNDDRVLDSVWENGKLWLSANSGCIPVGDTTLRSCARIVQLDTAARTVDWDTDLGLPGTYLFFPALRPDSAGNLVVALGESSPTLPPQLVALARTPDGSFTAPLVLAKAAGPYPGDRYGDYFGAARDPSTPGLVWVAGEVGSTAPGAEGWSTTIASVLVGAGAPTPAGAGSLAPRIRARSVTAPVGGPARLAYTPLDDASGVQATVVVRARDKVVYQATTASATVHAGQLYYVVWRPTRSLRGTFTFCVRSVAGDGTQSPPSCAAVRLR